MNELVMRRLFVLGPVAPTMIKSRFNWTKFIFDRRSEPSSSHISLHQLLELGSTDRRSADRGFELFVMDDADWLKTVTSHHRYEYYY